MRTDAIAGNAGQLSERTSACRAQVKGLRQQGQSGRRWPVPSTPPNSMMAGSAGACMRMLQVACLLLVCTVATTRAATPKITCEDTHIFQVRRVTYRYG